MIIIDQDVKDLAVQLSYIFWEDTKTDFCKKYGIPDTRYFGIDLVSPDMTRIVHVNIQSVITWADVAMFLAYKTLIFDFPEQFDMILATTPDTKISEMVLKVISKVIYIEPRVMPIEPKIVINHRQPNNHVLKKNKNTLAEEWIKNNPPVEKILRSEYYQKYTSEVEQCVCKDQLGKILRSVYGSGNIISPKIGDERCYHYIRPM